jgi:DNA repair protein RecO (recombination protein O)
VDLEYEPKRSGDLCFLHSCRLIDGFTGLRRGFSFLSMAGYMVELTEALVPSGVPDPAMFELLRQGLQGLSGGAPQGTIRVAFEARAMALAGYGIRFDDCGSCGRVYKGEGKALFRPDRGGIVCSGCGSESDGVPALATGSTQALRRMQSGEWDLGSGPGLDPGEAAQIRRVLDLHMGYRLGKRLKSARYIE